MDRNKFLKLSFVFGLIYFCSSNGIASLPTLTINFLLKDTLSLNATQAAYFGAVTVAGWALKPLWGLLSDSVLIFGQRRKPYLIISGLLLALVWAFGFFVKEFNVIILLAMLTASSFLFACIDVATDALMLDEGKPNHLTGKFQSIQWVSSYAAAAIAGLVGGWVVTRISPQQTFLINAIFPLLIAIVVFFLVKEEKRIKIAGFSKEVLKDVFEAFKNKHVWSMAFFLFFVACSPSFGAPFFYFAVDKLKFTPEFFGVVAMIGAIASAVGALIYGFISHKLRTKKFMTWIIGISVLTTLFDLVYFLPYIQAHQIFAQYLFAITIAILGIVGAITFLVILNAAALTAPITATGTTYAFLTAFWNLGTMVAAVFGGYLFSKIGLAPLIVVSAVFTAVALILIPFIKFNDEAITL